MMPRRTQLASFLAVSLLLFLYITFHDEGSIYPYERYSTPERDFQIAITELGGSHDEVVAALVHSFGSQPAAIMTVYQHSTRYGITEIMQNFTLPRPLPLSRDPLTIMTSGEPIPQILVSSTCELDIQRKEYRENMDRLLATFETHFFCVVHHAERWGLEEKFERLLNKWVAAERMTFLTLSPHTATHLQKYSLSHWKAVQQGHKADVQHFVPIYPVDLGEPDDSPQKELSFSIQGDYDSNRRDYDSIFKRLERLIIALKDKSTGSNWPWESSTVDGPQNITLNLLGHGERPIVPMAVNESVIFREGLDYQDFYKIMADGFAVVPAFATDEYYELKASSSVPAALIAGVPIIANQRMLQTYRYLDKDMAWFQKSDETDMDVIKKLALKVGPEGITKKKQLVRAKTKQLIEKNAKKLGSCVDKALKKAAKRREAKQGPTR